MRQSVISALKNAFMREFRKSQLVGSPRIRLYRIAMQIVDDIIVWGKKNANKVTRYLDLVEQYKNRCVIAPIQESVVVEPQNEVIESVVEPQIEVVESVVAPIQESVVEPQIEVVESVVAPIQEQKHSIDIVDKKMGDEKPKKKTFFQNLNRDDDEEDCDVVPQKHAPKIMEFMNANIDDECDDKEYHWKGVNMPPYCKICKCEKEAFAYMATQPPNSCHLFNQFCGKREDNGKDYLRQVVIPKNKVHTVIQHDHHLADVHLDNRTFFHLDIEKEGLDEGYKLEDHGFDLYNVHKACQIITDMFGLSNDPRGQFVVLEGHKKKKISLHVYWPKLILIEFVSMKPIIEDLKVNGYPDNQFIKYIDLNVIRPKGAMRNQNQSKFSDGIPLKYEGTDFISRTCVFDEDLTNPEFIVINPIIHFAKQIDQLPIAIAKKRVPNGNPQDVKYQDVTQDEVAQIRSWWEMTTNFYFISVRENYWMSKMHKLENGSYWVYLRNKGLMQHVCVCGRPHQGNNYHLYIHQNGVATVQCLSDLTKMYHGKLFKTEKSNRINNLNQLEIDYVQFKSQYINQDREDIRILDDSKHITCVSSDTGTGKSKIISTLCQLPLRILYLCTRITMKDHLISRLVNDPNTKIDICDYEKDKSILGYTLQDVKFYQEGDIIPEDKIDQYDKIGSTGNLNYCLFCQVDSIWKIQDIDLFDVIIIDESISVQHILMQKPKSLFKMNQIHRLSANNKPKKIFLLDALINESNIRFMQELFIGKQYNSDEIIIYHNTFKREITNYVYNADQQMLDFIQEAKTGNINLESKDTKVPSYNIQLRAKQLLDKLIQDNKYISICFDCEKHLLAFKLYLIDTHKVQPDEILVFHGTQDIQQKKHNISNLNNILESGKIRFVLYTQTVCVGVSIDQQHFKAHISIFTQFTSMYFEQYQMTYRSRFATDHHIFLGFNNKQYKKGYALDLPEYIHHKYYSKLYVRLSKITSTQSYIKLTQVLHNIVDCPIEQTNKKDIPETKTLSVFNEIAEQTRDRSQQLQLMQTHNPQYLELIVADYNAVQAINNNLSSQIQTPIDFSGDKQLIKQYADKLHQFQKDRQLDVLTNVLLYRANTQQTQEWLQKNNIKQIENLNDLSIKTYLKKRYQIMHWINNCYTKLLSKFQFLKVNTQDIHLSDPNPNAMWILPKTHELFNSWSRKGRLIKLKDELQIFTQRGLLHICDDDYRSRVNGEEQYYYQFEVSLKVLPVDQSK